MRCHLLRAATRGLSVRRGAWEVGVSRHGERTDVALGRLGLAEEEVDGRLVGHDRLVLPRVGRRLLDAQPGAGRDRLGGAVRLATGAARGRLGGRGHGAGGEERDGGDAGLEHDAHRVHAARQAGGSEIPKKLKRFTGGYCRRPGGGARRRPGEAACIESRERPFNADYVAMMRHFGMTPRTTAVGAKEQNRARPPPRSSTTRAARCSRRSPRPWLRSRKGARVRGQAPCRWPAGSPGRRPPGSCARRCRCHRSVG